MDIKIRKANLEGSVKAIPSKSMAHRYLICSALANEKTFIECDGTSKDIEATVDCLKSLGANIIRNNTIYEIEPIDLKKMKNAVINIDCGESGSTMRFLLPIVAGLGIKTNIFARGRLPQRPLSPLYEQMVEHKSILSKQGINPLKVDGKLTSGEYTLSASVSSQFISGLLFILPILDGNSVINLIGKIESKSYIYMTIQALDLFGIEVEFKESEDKNSIFIKGNQKYHSPKKLIVEGDWSNIAFWLCIGAIGKNTISCTNINTNSLQGDKKVLDILEKFGASIKCAENKIDVKKNRLQAIQIDASDIPDLIPVLSVVAAVSEGMTTVINAKRLRIKESDRLKTIAVTLKSLSADVEEKEEELIIRGKETLKGGIVDSYNDHRIVMMSAVASVVCDGEVVITNAQAVEKSYPKFFEDFCKLGGKIEKID